MSEKLKTIKELADELSHVAHRTENTPGSRTVEDGEKHTHYQGSEHDAIETEGKLSLPGFYLYRICPVPGNIKGPEQMNGLMEILCSLCHHHCEDDHLDEEEHEEEQESMTEPFG